MEHPKLYENIMKDKDVISALDYLRERQHGIRTFNLIDMLQKEIPKKNKELTKYMRAFEILKDKLDLTARECCDKRKKAFKKDYEIVAYSYHTFINKEEYELLEELMKSEKN